MNESEFAQLAAGHSLGALSVSDEQRFQAALAARPEWASIVGDDAQTASLLADAVPAVEPAPAIRDALLARIGTVRQDPAVEAGAGTVPVSDPGIAPGSDPGAAPGPVSASVPVPANARRGRRLMFALAACLALVVGLGVGAAVVIPQLLRPAAVVALDRIENAPDAAQKTVPLPSGGHATAHWSATAGAAVLVADDLPALPAEKTYELWFVRGSTPVSAGVFAAEPGITTAALSGTMKHGDAIAVTVEQAGGSPSGAPTSTPILVIPTS